MVAIIAGGFRCRNDFSRRFVLFGFGFRSPYGLNTLLVDS
jgi:hypothetical protein